MIWVRAQGSDNAINISQNIWQVAATVGNSSLSTLKSNQAKQAEEISI